MPEESVSLTDEHQFTTIEVSKKSLEEFRMAVSKKYRGRTHGAMFIEYSTALLNHAKRLNDEIRGQRHTTIFEPVVGGKQ